MPLIILLLLLGLPVLELAVLIDVGAEIGAISTVFLCLLTAATGLYLVRLQGLKVIQDLQNAAAKGGAVEAQLVHGFFLLIAGICLFIPGFLTDALGALLLIPPVRLFLGRAGLRRGSFTRGGRHGGTYTRTIIIDGEFTEKTGHHRSDKTDSIETIIHTNPTKNDEKT
ncbi:hypothetical protein GCM10017044_06770 [Kordiimonas sediminis]|uniref:FxsA family protein n=1 Tax=Kordiimonas sediminis TaxID=1735581 RepID=A0A919ANA8_9PROT|nr:FxsA family protein [Kordiimonas sediminis]GHF15277.1 hypothetical protein GCM10017044_06770 [Kordiimonas sediminis]